MLNKILISGITQHINAVGNLLDKLFTSDAERAQAQAVLDKLKQHPAELQVELNKIEAQHRSLFVVGWRPFIGWVCGMGLTNVYLINPWLQWLYGIDRPKLPLDVIVELIIAMLGLGTLRTVEKFSGKTKCPMFI